MSFLEVKNLKKSFGKSEILKGIDLTLEKGEVLAIIGSSGGGKTTLLRCLNFLEKADEGEITVGDKVVFSAKHGEKPMLDAEAQLSFGLVFQQFNLFPQYSVMDNLMLAPKLRAKRHKGKPGAETVDEIRARAIALLETVGLSDKADFYPCQLSGGQQQRVAIARALAINPGVLCFDEPTSALDPELTREVLKVILDLKRRGRTMIVVTHEMEFARKVSSKVIFMANGVIEEEGHPEELFEDPKSPILKNFLLSSKEGFDGEVDLSK